VTVRLSGTTISGVPVSSSVVTDAAGHFTFLDLAPGTYQLHQVQPTNFIDGKDTVGSLGGVVTNDTFSDIMVPPGVAGVDYLFGERGLTPAAISKRMLIASRTGVTPPLGKAGSGVTVLSNSADLSGHVYVDRNRNGRRDSGEPGIAGVNIQLTCKLANGRTFSLRTKTDASGLYEFSLLPPGTYSIIEKQPTGYRDGKESRGTRGGVVGPDRFNKIVLRAGARGTDYDFGELLTLLAMDRAQRAAN